MQSNQHSERYQKGMEILRGQFGKERAEKMIEGLTEAYEFFAKVNVEFPFGDLYSRRDVLDARTREIATIAALTVQGFSLPQLRIHIIAALNCGVKREEVLEIITQMIAYGGFPTATNAILTAKTLFDEIDANKIQLK